ncbi:MAG: DUF1592 domain-containing protein, partial [Gemmataceae bacterium]
LLKNYEFDSSFFPLPRDSYAGGKYPGLAELDRSGFWRERPGTTGMFRRVGEAFAGRLNQFSPTHAGAYQVRLSTWSFWWNKGKVEPSPRPGAAAIYYGSQPLGFFEAPSKQAKTHEREFHLTPNEYFKFDAASLWEVHVYHQKGRAAEYVGPGIALDYLEVDGPIHTEWPPPSHRKLFGDIPLVPLRHLPPAQHPERKPFQRPSHIHANNSHRSGEPASVVTNMPAAAAEKALGDFLPRLFRQPIDDATRQRYVRMVLDRLIAGDPFETAMRFALKAALCSPAFLFIADHSADSNSDARAEFHTKLRLFLTNSAMTKSAVDPRRTRRQQVEDLLREPESERFLVDFLSQWLSLRDIEATTPDPHLYPEYIPYLHDAIRREPAETLRTMLRENRPARDLVAADYVLANQRLAEHYNLPPIQGTDFRKVPLPKNHPHGGFLTMASIMKVTANGTS